MQAAFQKYYQATYLEGETEPNRLYDLEREIKNYHLFIGYEIDSFINAFYDTNQDDKAGLSMIERVVEKFIEVRYQFKHALIQDAAYNSILKSTRQKLHARVATVLKESLPEIITSQPELVAYHFTMAGLHSKAIPFWLEAGLLASRKHASSEAMVHLKKGLELIADTEEIDRKSELELDFMLALGGVSTVFYGYTHPEVEKVFSRAKVIAQKI